MCLCCGVLGVCLSWVRLENILALPQGRGGGRGRFDLESEERDHIADFWIV